MTDPERARAYLARKIPFGQMREASLAAGLSHSYIQQYLNRGKPEWLPWLVCDALAKWNPKINPERLVRSDELAVATAWLRRRKQRRGDLRSGDAEQATQITHDPETLVLLARWELIKTDPERRRAALDVIHALADDPGILPTFRDVA